MPAAALPLLRRTSRPFPISATRLLGIEGFSERAAQGEGITPQQSLRRLHIKGCPGREWAALGEPAKRLQAHGAVALVTRREALGLVQRMSNETDWRHVEVHLLPQGERLPRRLADLQLKSLGGVFQVPPIDYEQVST
jgi:DNA-binding MarR family transcriptional regulator